MRTLLVVMAVAIVSFGGWVQYRRQRAQENRVRVAKVEEAIKKAVTEIENLGGVVVSEHEEQPQRWLEKQFDDPGGADDPVGGLAVTEVAFVYDCTDVTDADLEHLKGLTKLEVLSLSFTQVTDAGLMHLKRMTALQELDLSYTIVSDAGLEHLKGLTKLRFLILVPTTVTPEGIKKLQRALPNCVINY